jgi:hypothetical protein
MDCQYNGNPDPTHVLYCAARLALRQGHLSNPSWIRPGVLARAAGQRECAKSSAK